MKYLLMMLFRPAITGLFIYSLFLQDYRLTAVAYLAIQVWFLIMKRMDHLAWYRKEVR